MNLIIRTISKSTSRKDLKEFVNKVLKNWFRLPFSARPTIVSCGILSVNDFTGGMHRHGVVDVTPDDAALKVIRKLNGELLKGKRVAVKQYRPVLKHSSSLRS